MHSLNSWKTQIYKSMLSSVATAWVKTLIMPGKGGGGGLNKFYSGRLHSEVLPLTLLYTIFGQKRYPIVSSTDKWYPFHIPSWDLCIPLFCRLFHSHKMHLSVSLFGLFKFFFFTDFSTLSYNSTREISTLSYTWNLKKVPLSGGASPYKAIMESNPPPESCQAPRMISVFIWSDRSKKHEMIDLNQSFPVIVPFQFIFQTL